MISIVDQLYVRRNERLGLDSEEGYMADQAVKGSNYYTVSNSDSLTVVFPPWHASARLNRWIRRRLAKEGSDVLLYDVHHNILSSDPLLTRESFNRVAEIVSEDIRCLRTNTHYEKLNLLGFSIGNVALSMAASRIDDFDRVTMVVPGTQLAQPFFEGRRTKQLSNAYRERGYTLKYLQDLWRDLAPEAHLEKLQGKEIRIIRSNKDIYIPSRSALALVEQMQKIGLQPSVFLSKMGHVATIAAYAKNYIK